MKRRFALIDMAYDPDPPRHRRQIEAALGRARSLDASLALLPELVFHPYFCQTESPAPFAEAQVLDGERTDCLRQWARKYGIVIVTSLFERRLPGIFHNTAIVVEQDGSVAGIYRKMHIPDDPGYFEKYYFTPGDTGFCPIDCSAGRLGVLVCWDQWFPEAARLMSLAGADCLLYPTAIGWNPEDPSAVRSRELDAWITIQRAHAIANGCPVLVANRVGHEADPSGHSAGIRFWGHGFAAGPQGEYLLPPDSEQSSVRVVELEEDRTAAVRTHWPFLRDRRTDAYGGIIERTTRGIPPDLKKPKD